MITIAHIELDHKGYFKAEEDGKEAGRITYTRANNDRMIMDHTEVSDAFRGRNVGKLIVQAAVEYARKSKIKIVPLCPFVKSVFDKTPEYQDLL